MKILMTVLIYAFYFVSVPVSPPRNLTIYNHSAVSVWLSWESPLEPNGVVIHYGFRIQDLITHTVTQRVQLISHSESNSILTITDTHITTLWSHTLTDHGSNFTLRMPPSTNVLLYQHIL